VFSGTNGDASPPKPLATGIIADEFVDELVKESKLLMNRPIRVAKSDMALETPKSSLSQAQRVLKAQQPELSTKPRLKPAQRVLSQDSSMDIVDLEPKPQSAENIVSKIVDESKKSDDITFKKFRAKPYTRKPIATESSSRISFAQLERDVLSTDWAKRNRLFEELEQYFQEMPTLDYLSPFAVKAGKLILQGLNDQHFKVITAALGAFDTFVRDNIPTHVFSKLFPRILGISHYPHQKPKPSLLEKCNMVLESILTRISPNLVAQAIVNAFGNADFSLKVKVGCIMVLSSFDKSKLEAILSKPSSTQFLT
jgi:hypothetical protein